MPRWPCCPTARRRFLTCAEVPGLTRSAGGFRFTSCMAHRAVLVNLIARCAPAALVDIADILQAVDSISPGRGLASVLADLATTRHRMLDELG